MLRQGGRWRLCSRPIAGLNDDTQLAEVVVRGVAVETIGRALVHARGIEQVHVDLLQDVVRALVFV
eukprot:658104-Alexandrium_andersonii.AAC.1